MRRFTVSTALIGCCPGTAEEYDPDTFDELPIKYALGRIANRRNAARARIARKHVSTAA
jgi:hypothetical protein